MEGKTDYAEGKEEPKALQPTGRGRRPRASIEASSKAEEDSPSQKNAPSEPVSDAPARPRRRRATENEGKSGDDDNGGGWMTGGGGKSRKSAEAEEEDDDAHVTTQNKDKHFRDDGDEIVLIPDLDEDGGADADQRIAHAPRNVHRRIPTLAELENEVKATVPTTEEGLNLTVLLSTLVPAGMVNETDEAWTFESLLREITDELSDTPKTVVSTTIPAGAVSGGSGKGNSPKGRANRNSDNTGGGGAGKVDGFEGFNKRSEAAGANGGAGSRGSGIEEMKHK